MTRLKKIVAINGSSRHLSLNGNLIRAIEKIFSSTLDIQLCHFPVALPPFNPDLDTGNVPAIVTHYREQLNAADGILICTPEYAMGVPGTLKNALDWTVSSMEFSGKPVALITASASGHRCHASILETLKVIEAVIPESSRLLISYIATKVKDDIIIDALSLSAVKKVVGSLIKTIEL